MGFRLRRVKWEIKALKEEEQEIKAWKVLRKAGIRNEYANEVKWIIEGIE